MLCAPAVALECWVLRQRLPPWGAQALLAEPQARHWAQSPALEPEALSDSSTRLLLC